VKLHPLVQQLYFTRNELKRCLDGVENEEAKRRFGVINSISWMVGHLADQENRYWNLLAQGKRLAPELRELVGYGKPASTPNLDKMWTTWIEITTSADNYLVVVNGRDLETQLIWKDKQYPENIGTMLMRNIYHYWFHIGEAYAVRQLLGHSNLPDFVGDIPEFSPKHPPTFRPTA